MNTVQQITISIIPLIFAITVHEVAHGWVAWKLGDPTAKMLGRLTLNPIKHIDPIGTIVVPLFLFVTSGFMFGWAKPVPVNKKNLASPDKSMALVAVAGPAANLLMAIGWFVVLKIGISMSPSSTGALWFLQMAQVGIFFNIILMALNILPIPPLDGSRILYWLLPPRLATKLDLIEPYGFFIIIGLMLTGVLSAILTPVIQFTNKLLF